MIQRYRIIGTRITVYAAYEPSSIFGPHHTITQHDGAWYGAVATKQPAADILALPYGDMRIEAVRAWYEIQYELAYDAILAQYPELANNPTARFVAGDIETTNEVD